MEDKHKQKVKEIIDRYEEKAKLIRNRKRWNAWIKNNYAKLGFSYSRYRGKISELVKIHAYDKLELKHEKFIKEQELDVKSFADIVDEYIVLHTSEKQNAIKRTWYVYHFFNGDKLDREPSLGRAVLTVDQKNTAIYKNVPTGKDYEGKCHEARNDTVFFNLNSIKDKKEPVSSTHIRVYANDLFEDEIILGAYITYEADKIARGAIILHAIEDEDTKEPILLSYKNNIKELKGVHWAIKRYLSLKRVNFRTVYKGVNTLSRLEKFLEQHHFDKWETRFVEEGIPCVFISTPSSSLSPEKQKVNGLFISKLKAKLESRFNPDSENKKLEIYQEDRINLHHTEVPIPLSLVPLKRTRFFIMILPKTKRASFSLIELGWALSHAKVVMVFYEDSAISDRIKTLKKMGVIIEEYNAINESDVEKLKNDEFESLDKKSGFNKIYEIIENTIDNNLGDYA